MPRPGGESDKLGNQFEAVWTVDAVIDVFIGSFKSITIEAFGDESQGVEFHLQKHDDSKQFHSVKRQKQGGDWSVADLCRKDKATGRSILGDLFAKHDAYPNSETRFVSSTGANELRELSERADTPRNLVEFRKAVSPKLQSKFDQHILPLCGDDAQSAFAALKKCEVILRTHRDLVRTVERRVDELFYRTDGSSLRPDDVRRMVADFVLENLGPSIDVKRLESFFDEKGLAVWEWKSNTHIQNTVADVNRRYLSVTETELINSSRKRCVRLVS